LHQLLVSHVIFVPITCSTTCPPCSHAFTKTAMQLFLTHLHGDHIADAVNLLSLGPMLGGRAQGPLHVYGPSGPTPETGTAAFVEGLNRLLA
jgi:ribonuclease BN (tRNA processing enzyme)